MPEYLAPGVFVEETQSADPLAAFAVILAVGRIRAGFSEVSGLSAEPAIRTSKQGRAVARRLEAASRRDHGRVTLKRGLTVHGRDLEAWLRKAAAGRPERMRGTITLRDEAMKPALTWELAEAWPLKWEGPQWTEGQSEVAIQELVLSVQGVTLQAGAHRRW